MSYKDVCAIAWKGYAAGKGTGKKGPNGPGVWHIVEEERMDVRVAEEMMQARRAPRAANLIGTVKRTEEALETEAKDKGQGKGKRDTRYCYDYGELGHIGMNCPYKWTNSIDEDEQTSWESELDGQEAEEPACLETPDDEGEWCWPRRNKITRWRAG